MNNIGIYKITNLKNIGIAKGVIKLIYHDGTIKYYHNKIDFSKNTGINRRTLEDWINKVNKCRHNFIPEIIN